MIPPPQPEPDSRAAARAATAAIRAAARHWGSAGPQAVLDALEQATVDRLLALLHREA